MCSSAKNLQTVILRDANHLEALNNYGVLLLRHHSYHNAALFFEKTVDLDPSSYVWSNLACAYSGAGRLSDAARAFRHARDLDDSNTQATCNLAHHISAMMLTEADPAARAKKLEQAEHMYSSVLCDDKRSTQAWAGLAGIFNKLADAAGDAPKVREYKELALEAFSHAVESGQWRHTRSHRASSVELGCALLAQGLACSCSRACRGPGGWCCGRRERPALNSSSSESLSSSWLRQTRATRSSGRISAR